MKPLDRIAAEWGLSRVEVVAISGLIALHFGVSTYFSAILNIWIDEAFSLATTGSGIVHAFKQALRFELQPPLYFVSLSVWRFVDDSIFFARMFSVIAVTGSIVASIGVSRRYLPGVSPVWVVACMALHPYFLWAGTEIRVYGSLILLSALLLMFFYDGFLTDDPKPRARWYYGAAALAALYCQYYMGFLLAANGAALVATGRWRAIPPFLATALGVAVGFAPMLIILGTQVTDHSAVVTDPPDVMTAGRAIGRHLQELAIPFFNFTTRQWLAATGLALLLSGALFSIRWRHVPRQSIALWLFAAIPGVIFGTIMYFMSEDLVLRRHCAGWAVIMTLLPFSLTSCLPAGSRNWIAAAWFVLVAFSTGLALPKIYEPMAKEGDMERMAQFIEEREEPDQPILIFPKENVFTLSYYYDGKNRVVPIPDAPDFDRFDPVGATISSPGAVARALDAVPGDHDRIWVITTMAPGDDVYFGVDFGSEHLETFLRGRYRTITAKSFLGGKLLYLRKR